MSDVARILMASVPAYGLANPSLPLARALVRAGHEVDFLLAESFRAPVEALGATLVPFASYLPGPITSPRHLARHGRRLGPDPASETACTVGGVLAKAGFLKLVEEARGGRREIGRR